MHYCEVERDDKDAKKKCLFTELKYLLSIRNYEGLKLLEYLDILRLNREDIFSISEKSICFL